MWKNYLKTSWRYLIRNRFYTGINIFSLVVGISIFMVIVLLYQTKVTRDYFHKDADSIYRIVAGIDEAGKDAQYIPLLSKEFVEQCQSNIPSVKAIAQYGNLTGVGKKGTHQFHEQIQLVSPNFFQFFDFPFKEGKSELLTDNHAVVISSKVAEKYFGEDSAIGQTLELRMNSLVQTYRVSGVLDNKAFNSKIELEMVVPNVYSDRVFHSINEEQINRPYENFIKLRKDVDLTQLEASTTQLLSSEFSEYKEDTEFSALIQSLKVSSWAEGIPNISSSRTPLYVFLSLAFIILLISCVNFSTLTIGNAFKRTKEVGVRKVNGAYGSHLKVQFLMESILTALVAGLIAFPVIYQLVGLLNNLAGINVIFADLLKTDMLLFYGFTILLAGVMAGFYPAFNIARFTTQNLLKNRIHLGGKNTFSKILITAQFTVSLFFVVLAVLISKQVYHFENADTGFQKEKIVLINNPVEISNKSKIAQQFLTATQQQASVELSALSTTALNHNDWNYWPYYYNDEEGQYYHYNYIDGNFIDLYQIEMAEGRNFKKVISEEASNVVLVNQVFVERYQLENPVGNIINIGEEDVTIVGVVKDFYFRNLKRQINPLVLRPLQVTDSLHTPNTIAVKISGDMPEAVASLKETWQKMVPEHPFDYVFVEDEMNNSYIDIAQIGTIASFASTLVSFVALLGLFGLIVLVSSRKTKEIAIRKVIGAPTTGLIWVLSKNLLSLVGLAVLIALPLATFFFSVITDNFMVKVPFDMLFYLLVVVVSFVIAMFTMGLHTFRVSLQNPVKSLRDD